MKKYIKNCLFILFFTFSLYLNAEVVSSSKFEYTIDFPEGFFIEDMSKAHYATGGVRACDK